ncbi:hypothetical protein PHYPSEUDO_011472 [Phytophthora pseudosyringae]|uniref:Uncharacterized protein n=1 Tax=Phytophthora pseudosyringae TaxID=221518 RepID=A0A8T1WBF7_9STRA|nr:hypothetical protein PHYPSEUDO_011472 [Phytophthora pseudosyringae]
MGGALASRAIISCPVRSFFDSPSHSHGNAVCEGWLLVGRVGGDGSLQHLRAPSSSSLQQRSEYQSRALKEVLQPRVFFKFFHPDSDSQELTPSSISGISVSSQATIIDLAQADTEEKIEATSLVPDNITHGPLTDKF